MNPILLACHTIGQPTNYIRITGSPRLDIEPCIFGMNITATKGTQSYLTTAHSVEIVPSLPSYAEPEEVSFPMQ